MCEVKQNSDSTTTALVLSRIVKVLTHFQNPIVGLEFGNIAKGMPECPIPKDEFLRKDRKIKNTQHSPNPLARNCGLMIPLTSLKVQC